MTMYIVKRIGQTILVIFILSFFVFMLVSFLPGDPVYSMLGGDISKEEYTRVYNELQLNKPVFIRYFSWLKDAVHLNFGQSLQYHRPIIEILSERIPVTLFLSLFSFVLSMPIGILFGVISAVHRGKIQDNIVTLLANLTVCLPQFWLAVLLLYVFSMKLGWLPSYGFDWAAKVGWQTSLRQMILPVICLTMGGIASTTRQTRSSMLEVIRLDYVRTARSKGLSEKKVIYVHALKNALIPVISLMGLKLGTLIGGSMFVESVFSISGMGSLFVKAITTRDIPLVQACVLLVAAITCIVNLFTDIIYALVDPRIRLE